MELESMDTVFLALGSQTRRKMLDVIQNMPGCSVADVAKNVWWPTTIWVEYERTKGVVIKKDGLIDGFNICVTTTILRRRD